jgi:NitT/TauT family transport system substrate-binding protein
MLYRRDRSMRWRAAESPDSADKQEVLMDRWSRPLVFKVLVLALVVGIAMVPGTSGATTNSAKLTTVHFRTGFGIGPWDAGYYVAQTQGYYKKAGLNVVIDQGQGSFSNVQLAASGQADMVSAAAPAMIEANANGASLKMVASFIQSGGSGILTKPEITNVNQLEGKTLWGGSFDFTTNLFPIYARAAHIDPGGVHVVTAAIGDAVTNLQSGKYDGVFGVGWGEVEQAKVDGLKFNWFPYAKAGLNYIGPGVVASTSWLSSHLAQAKAFATATAQGWQYAELHPTAAAAAVRKVEPTLKAADVVAIEKVYPGYNYTVHTKGSPLGRMALADWQATMQTLTTAGLIKSPLDPSAQFVNLIPANSPYKIGKPPKK